MPDILLFIASPILFIVFMMIALIEQVRTCFILAAISVLTFIWPIVARSDVEKHLVGTYDVHVINNIAYIQVDGKMINMNTELKRNINENTKINIYEYDTWKYGILITAGRIFEILE